MALSTAKTTSTPVHRVVIHTSAATSTGELESMELTHTIPQNLLFAEDPDDVVVRHLGENLARATHLKLEDFYLSSDIRVHRVVALSAPANQEFTEAAAARRLNTRLAQTEQEVRLLFFSSPPLSYLCFLVSYEL